MTITITTMMKRNRTPADNPMINGMLTENKIITQFMIRDQVIDGKNQHRFAEIDKDTEALDF